MKMANAVEVGSSAPDLVYGTSQGDKHLADLWSDRPALVLWLRHFG